MSVIQKLEVLDLIIHPRSQMLESITVSLAFVYVLKAALVSKYAGIASSCI